MKDTFKLPGGRVITMQRAIAMGLADGEGNAAAPAVDSRGAAVLAKEQRRAAWTAKQAGKPAKRQRGATRKTEPGEPETTADGKMRKRREPKPLVPQNVTPEGEPITDEETLAEIAERTAAIEAERARVEAEAASEEA